MPQLPHPDFVREHTTVGRAPLVPEIELHLASEVTSLWTASEAWLAERGVEPPYWAFAWAGGQALARYVLDHPNLVRGKTVLDVASGGGIVALAAARAGASRVVALDPDPIAASAVLLNAAQNRLKVEAHTGPAELTSLTADVITAGDVFYDAKMTAALLPWLRDRCRRSLVLLGDPSRAYRPRDLPLLRTYEVAVDPGLEGKSSLTTTIHRLDPLPPH